VNSTYEQVSNKSSEDTPRRKYSTRGVKVDFAKLLAGINRKEALIEDSEVETVEITRSDDKNKKKTSSNLSKALTKRQKALLAKSVKKTSTKESPEDDQTSDESEKDENLDESQDETYVQDDFLDNDETADDTGGNGDMDDDAHGGGDMDDATLTSSSTAFLVKKYRLSTCAVIPKILVPVATPSKKTSDKPSKISGRKWFNVVDKYGCMKCEFTCTNFISCSDHMIKEHSADSIFRCDICERHFDKSYHLKIHLETKHGPQLDVKQLQCQYCKKEYVNAYALELHVDSIHRNPERSKFSCRRCSFVGEDRPDLETHVQENHYHVGVMCTVCGKTFRNKNFLDQHTENIHVKRTEYNCTICDKTFRNKRSFFQHKSVHSDVKKYPCPFCGKSFRKRGNMMAHVETHREKEDRSYRYSCNYCSRKMNSKANFVEHMNKHTGDRPFLCEICGKSFSYRTAVYKHKTFCHNTNAPFKCTVCDKSFKVLRLLNQHMTTHTGQSHYKCDGCEKMFTTTTTLKNHKPKCKGINFLQPMSGNVVIFSSPTLGTQHVEIAAGESIFQTRHINYKEENTVSTDTVVPESGALVIAETNELPKTNIEAPAMEVGSDVAVYLCSECNAVFNDFSLAEQHVLMGHEPTSSTNQMQPSNNNVVEAVNVVFKEVPDSL
jgi:stress-induced morphogen